MVCRDRSVRIRSRAVPVFGRVDDSIKQELVDAVGEHRGHGCAQRCSIRQACSQSASDADCRCREGNIDHSISAAHPLPMRPRSAFCTRTCISLTLLPSQQSPKSATLTYLSPQMTCQPNAQHLQLSRSRLQTPLQLLPKPRRRSWLNRQGLAER